MIEVGKFYYYKDKRIVKVIQIDNKRQRAEVIEEKWNPFWVNYSALIQLTDII